MSTIVKIQHLRGTAAQWADRNPTLPEAEFGVETDTLKVKVGDGSTPWNELGYVNPAGAGTVVERSEENITWSYDGLNYYYTWTHNLARIPQVTILEGTEVVEVQVSHTSANELVLYTSAAFTNGKIVATY